MAKNGSHKLKILYLMKMFLEQTDEEHSIGIADIIRELENYGISAERKSIYADIDTLKVFGLDISKKKSKSTEYYLASRPRTIRTYNKRQEKKYKEKRFYSFCRKL